MITVPKLLPVPYHPQNDDGYCLVACTEIDEFMLAWREIANARPLAVA